MRLRLGVSLLLYVVPSAHAQIFSNGGNFGHGFRFDSASLSGMYYSNLSGATGGFGGLLPNSSESAVLMQAAGLFEWSSNGPKGQVEVTYSPGYVRRLGTGDFHSLNHSLSFAGQRTLSSKWTLGASMVAYLTDFSQLLFSQSRMAQIASTDATFEELFTAMLTGRADQAVLAGLVSQMPTASSPESSYVYGNRQMGLLGTTTLSYAASTRSSYFFSAGYVRNQAIQAGASSQVAGPVLLPKTDSGFLQFGWSYSLTPRTTVSAGVAESRIVSNVQNVSTTQSNISIGRTLTPHWFVQASAGVGITRPKRQQLVAIRQVQEQWSGTAGYRFRAQTFVGSFSRSASDVYGVGAEATLTGSGAWTWARPGTSYSTAAAFGYSRLLGQAYNYSGSWHANASFAKSLGAHSEISVGYSYVQFPPSLLQTAVATTRMQSTDGLTATVTWFPEPRRARSSD